MHHNPQISNNEINIKQKIIFKINFAKNQIIVTEIQSTVQADLNV